MFLKKGDPQYFDKKNPLYALRATDFRNYLIGVKVQIVFINHF
jgi:hypothetical protein